MKKTLHTADSRGRAEHGWLSSRFSFSFAEYYNPERIHFGMLRVLNDDIIQPDMGFGMHPHDNMEIVTIPLLGALEHRDSMGNGSIIKAGEVQLMSAGTGIRHSEFNPSHKEDAGLLQIWVFPKLKNITPRYEQGVFDPSQLLNQWQLIVSPDGKDNSLVINQDAWFSLTKIVHGESITYSPKQQNNGMYLFVIEGGIIVGDTTLGKRDAVGISETENIVIEAVEDAFLLLMDIPMR
jgi:redox-sensitive bicupin YhaK (pirin superfamily)